MLPREDSRRVCRSSWNANGWIHEEESILDSHVLRTYQKVLIFWYIKRGLCILQTMVQPSLYYDSSLGFSFISSCLGFSVFLSLSCPSFFLWAFKLNIPFIYVTSDFREFKLPQRDCVSSPRILGKGLSWAWMNGRTLFTLRRTNNIQASFMDCLLTSGTRQCTWVLVGWGCVIKLWTNTSDVLCERSLRSQSYINTTAKLL